MRTAQFVVTADDSKKDRLKAASEARRAALSPFAGKGYWLLSDAREGPLRNDAALEAESSRARTEISTFFVKAAVLVKTATGALQLNRLNTRDKINAKVFENDEAGALRYLMEP